MATPAASVAGPTPPFSKILDLPMAPWNTVAMISKASPKKGMSVLS